MKHALLASFCAFTLLSCAIPTREQSLVSRAVDAVGGAQALGNIRTISARGTVKHWEPEQSDAPGGEMRYIGESSWEAIVDSARGATRIDWDRKLVYIPRTFTFSEIVTPDAGYVIGVDSSGRNAQNLQSNPPAHSMSGQRLAATQRELRRAGVAGLLLAMQNNPDQVRPAPDIVVQGRSYPAVSYQGLIVAFDPQTGLPARTRTLDYDNIWGDVNYDYVYSQWRDIDRVKVAMNRKYELDGRVVADIDFSEIRFNPPIDSARLEIPAAIRAGAAKPATRNVLYQWVLRRQFVGFYMDSENPSFDTRGSPGLRLQEVAPGVHHVQGGTHHSLVVEMSDHLIVIDAPITDAQSLWLVGQTRARFPGKPIRWLALTHHHMDHAGGLRGILAEGGVTLVVGQGAGAHFRRVLAAPMARNSRISLTGAS